MTSSALTRGSVFKTVLSYSFPLIITNVIQILFHAADVATLALMADDLSVAAVGACGSIISLLICLFAGLATGTGVLVARRTGMGDEEGVKKASGAAIITGLITGAILMAIGVIFAEQLLLLTNCRPQVLPDATLYMQIYFLGMPIIMLYNFLAATLRARGDSLRPMVYMIVSGVLNVGLNVFLVGLCGLTASGVAIATVASNAVSAILALIAVFKPGGVIGLRLKNMTLGKEELITMIKIGVPVSLCSLSFYFANIVFSAAVNSISTEAMTANAIANQFDGIVYNVGYSIALAVSSIQGQNIGAKLFGRMGKTMTCGILYATALSLTVGGIFVLLSDPITSIMTDSPAVAALAKDRMILLCLTYFVTSIMEVFSFTLSAAGKQVSVMITGFLCGFLLRCSWVWLIWPLNDSFSMLFAGYGVSAAAATLIYVFVYINAVKRLRETLGSAERGG